MVPQCLHKRATTLLQLHKLQWQRLRCQGSGRVLWQKRWNSNTTDNEKPYYVTTPIFYVNAEPHVGHLYSMLLADVLKRWQVVKGRKAILLTGTDEYGMKIQQAAARSHTEPKAFCDQVASTFKDLANKANISHDRFFRTTDPDHKEAVQYAWRLLREKDYIYTDKHEGWYCVSDETFYPSTGVERIRDAQTGQIIIVSKETGKLVEWTSEENFHFRLSALQPLLLEHYRNNPDFIMPKNRMAEVVEEVSKGLEDLSISRPRERLSWGIPVPNNEEQTIYVWLDALINYITASGFPWTPGKELAGGWPADVHVIGKDIVRFHCIYWPAFLLAMSIPLPKQILAHAHWTMQHRKMSKSAGIVVNPFYAMTRFGVDPMRFYLTHDGGIASDGDYSNEEIIVRYTKNLQSQVGSLLTRVCSKAFDLEVAIKEAREVIVNIREQKMGEGLGIAHEEQIRRVGNLRTVVDEKMKEFDFSGALKAILEVVACTHKYLHNTEPWAPSSAKDRSLVMYLSAEATRISGILLQPFMPTKMQELLDMLSVGEHQRTFKDAKLGGDGAYGVGSSGRKDRIFPVLSSLS